MRCTVVRKCGSCPLEPVCVDPLEASLAGKPRKAGPAVLSARITAAEVLVRPATSPLHCLQGVCVGSVLICVDLPVSLLCERVLIITKISAS